MANAHAKDYCVVDSPAAEKVLMDYAVKLTRTLEDVTSADHFCLRSAFLDDRGILDIT